MKVQTVNVLSPTWDVNKDSLPSDESIKLAFVNFALDPSILASESEATRRLTRVFTEVAGSLHADGTLVMAMESMVSFDFNYIKGKCTVSPDNFKFEGSIAQVAVRLT